MTLESDAKFEEKLTCGLENNMKNLANFHQSTWKSQNKMSNLTNFHSSTWKLGLEIGLLCSTLIPSRKWMSLKFTVMCYDNEERSKFEKELTSSKLTWGI